MRATYSENNKFEDSELTYIYIKRKKFRMVGPVIRKRRARSSINILNAHRKYRFFVDLQYAVQYTE